MTTAIINSPNVVEGIKGAKLMTSLIFPFDPVPASRPRVTRWGTYYGKTYASWKKNAEKFLKQGDLDIPPKTPIVVKIETIVKRPKTSKAAFPSGDVDNYAKGPMDVITKVGGYWGDDRQVVHLVSDKRFASAAETPCTKVHIYICD